MASRSGGRQERSLFVPHSERTTKEMLGLTLSCASGFARGAACGLIGRWLIATLLEVRAPLCAALAGLIVAVQCMVAGTCGLPHVVCGLRAGPCT